MKFIEALIAFVSIAGSSTAFQSPVAPSKAVSSRGRNTVVSGSALLAATLDGTAVNVPTGVKRKKTKQVSIAAACLCDEKQRLTDQYNRNAWSWPRKDCKFM